MGSYKHPSAFDTDRAAPDADTRPKSTVRLDCPPEVAVAFLAKLYSASPEFAERGLSLERPPQDGAEQ